MLSVRQIRFPLKFPPTKSFLRFKQNQPPSGARIPVSVIQLALALAGTSAMRVVSGSGEYSSRYQLALPISSVAVLQVVLTHLPSSAAQSLCHASRGKCGTAPAVATGIYHSRRTARIHSSSDGTPPSRHPPSGQMDLPRSPKSTPQTQPGPEATFHPPGSGPCTDGRPAGFAVQSSRQSEQSRASTAQPRSSGSSGSNTPPP